MSKSKDYLTFTVKGKDEFSGTMDNLGSKLSAAKVPILAIGAAATAAAVGVFALTKKTAESFDKVQKFSDRIGISTEAMSKLNHAADLSGVSTRTMSLGLQRMTRRISEAAAGTGVAGKALEELGIPIDAIKNKKPDEQFEAVAEAMSKVKNQSDKVRLAMALYDSEGVAVLQTMKDGAKGIRDAGDEAERLGLVISSKAGVAAANFNDSLLRMTSSVKGLGLGLATKLMPTMTNVMNSVSRLVTENQEIFETLGAAIGTVAKGVIISIKSIIAIFGAFKDAIETISDTIGVFFDTTQKGWKNFTDGARTALKTLGAVETKIIETYEKQNKIKNPYTWDNDGGSAKPKKTDKETDVDISRVNLRGEKSQSFYDTGIKKTVEVIMEAEKIIVEKMGSIKQTLSESMATDDEASTGIHPFTNKNIEKAKENIAKEKEDQELALANLRVLYEEHTLSEDERLDIWRERELVKVGEHENGKRMIEELYAEKKKKSEDKKRKLKENIEAKTQKKRETLQKQANEREIKASNERYDSLYRLSTLFGKKGAILSSALAVYQTRNDTKAAAIAAYKAMAGIPIVGPALGAAAAAAAIAFGNSQVSAITGNLLGVAHGGADYIPKEGTYLLDKGEKVLSPRQNIDLTNFLDNEKSGNSGYARRAGDSTGGHAVEGNITINIEVLPNATNADAMLNMDKNDWEEIVLDQVMPAMAILKKQGMDYETL